MLVEYRSKYGYSFLYGCCAIIYSPVLLPLLLFKCYSQRFMSRMWCGGLPLYSGAGTPQHHSATIKIKR